MLRRLVFSSGAISISLFLISVIFKLKHLQGAEWILLISLVAMAFVFVPSLAVYLYKQGQK